MTQRTTLGLPRPHTDTHLETAPVRIEQRRGNFPQMWVFYLERGLLGKAATQVL